MDERRAAEAQREAAEQPAADRVAELEQQLADARERAKALGARPKRTTTSDRDQDREIRDWAKANDIPINDRGLIPGRIRDQYNDAHAA
ncbi:Lsr2 family DNA-binding protein [Nonomuraea terrae]|uniref:Lsr2 family DNA-binding protein n=1 Tax=Nonomuraea terrae TaxID=2530383 RepID=UPI0014046A68|nr:histone-like nucleoid-structuring protein Lsr2 [Nonomuraea terrae]